MIVQEEFRAGLVGQAGPHLIVNLDMVQVREVAQQAQPLARLAQLRVALTGGQKPLQGDLLHAIDQPGGGADGLSIARVLAVLPIWLDALPPAFDVRIGREDEALHRFGRPASREHVQPDVVVKQCQQHIGTVRDVFGFFANMLVGVDQRGGLNVMFQIGGH